MIGGRGDMQDAYGQIFDKLRLGYARREYRDLVPKLLDAARDINTVSLQAPAGK